MFEIVGIKKVDYVSKKTGKHVQGFTLFMEHERKDVVGTACEEVYVSNERISHVPQVGDFCDVYYNKFGSVESVMIDESLREGEAS